MRIVLDLRKTVEQNAAEYFEHAKKLKNKAKGARVAVAKFKAQLAARESRPSASAPTKTVTIKETKSRLWYEKFRWFLSSEGYLCVGGRDAGSNEVIVKKHAEPHDLLCHTEAPGSPFFVIKTEGNPPQPATVEEASQATASYSRGWKLGVTVMDAYCVTPEQVSKEAQSGEFMSKGSFMVRGKRQTLRVSLKLAIGLLPDGRIMGGPERAVRKHCAKVMLVTHGSDKPSDAAKKVQKHLGGGDLDEIIRALPPGDVKVAGA
jgi:predicted ribosome quality control (RQC) complex YloA/Tae2 family protein